MFLTGQIAPYWFVSITNRLLFLFESLSLPLPSSVARCRRRSCKMKNTRMNTTEVNWSSSVCNRVSPRKLRILPTHTHARKQKNNIRLSVLFRLVWLFVSSAFVWFVCCAIVYVQCVCICTTWKPMRRSLSTTANQSATQTMCDANEAKRESFICVGRVCVCVRVRTHRDSGVDRSRSFSLDRLFCLSFQCECTHTLSLTHTTFHCVSSFHFTSFIWWTKSKIKRRSRRKRKIRKKRWAISYMYSIHIHAAFRLCVKLFKSIFCELLIFIFPPASWLRPINILLYCHIVLIVWEKEKKTSRTMS